MGPENKWTKEKESWWIGRKGVDVKHGLSTEDV